MDINILVKSSTQPDSSYKINFSIKGGLMRIHCSCPAGTRGQLCKHKISLIEGNHNMLFDISQRQIMNDIFTSIKTSPLKSEYSKFVTKKKEIEKLQRGLKQELKDIKIDLAMRLYKGIKN
jgi:hypothetical protein